MKIKFATKYPSNEVAVGVCAQRENGPRELVETYTSDDVAKYVKYQSKVKCIVIPSKLWIIPPTGNTDTTYGISFKLQKVLVELPPEKPSLQLMLKSTDGFIESDDEEVLEVDEMT